MQIRPILSALRRHKAGTILIALQIALTLAIVCNALFIVHERVERVSRTTGMNESDVVAIQNRYVGTPASYVPLVKTDIQALRAMPGVEDAYATNAFPLRQGGWSTGVQLKPDGQKDGVQTALYFGDEHALKTLGVQLIAGRNFNAGEITPFNRDDRPAPPQVIVTKKLADKLFPNGDALGKTVYYSKGRPSTIVGIVAKLTVPWTEVDFPEMVTIMPLTFNSSYQIFLVRAKPGQQDAVFRSVAKTLYDVNRMRVLPEKYGVRTFEMVRSRAYEKDRGMAILMSVVCAVLLAITAAGIVGLSSFWVGQRRKQIGVRRALGARRSDILSYFMTENFLIALAGVVVGVVLAIGMSQWMFTHFEMQRLSFTYILVGVVALLALGQAAVFAPALKASKVSPVEATRSV
ncbi:putative ABC transport system permease protein [Luteibacter sp. UNC138MFCol5.1]|uniref:ABC transporter permease n=1 Tax=Luteibacter sp. UNC138MFCol5.1 TaxID=1502774 RepID=UPI0008CF7BDC|nr:FtsX-like permease family protein [Luteibacter sp. UNC138MFCol5.1]SEO65393.1 putative ABC transport system permease protein [Luteibacter sp. UNC138MFCol5.1]